MSKVVHLKAKLNPLDVHRVYFYLLLSNKMSVAINLVISLTNPNCVLFHVC